MRILFVTSSPTLHGANRSLLALALHLRDSHQCDPLIMLPSEGDLARSLRISHIPYRIRMVGTWMAPNRKGIIGRTFKWFIGSALIARDARRHKADLILTNMSVTPAGALASLLARIPHIWYVREFGWHDFGLRPDWGFSFFYALLNKSLHVFFVSHALKEHYSARCKAPSSVVYNGVFSHDAPVAQRILSGAVRTFCTIGQIHEGKGQEDAIRALYIVRQRHPDATLLLVGDDRTKYALYLKKLVIDLGLSEAVTFTGFVHDPFMMLEKADCFVSCSRSEGMGRNVAEAMLVGLPVIVYDAAGSAEIVGNSGLVYKDNYNALAEHMLSLASGGRDAQALGNAARARALTLFDEKAAVAAVAAKLRAARDIIGI